MLSFLNIKILSDQSKFLSHFNVFSFILKGKAKLIADSENINSGIKQYNL